MIVVKANAGGVADKLIAAQRPAPERTEPSGRGLLAAAWRVLGACACVGTRGARLWVRWRGDGAAARDLAERLALSLATANLPRRGVWLHGASVGEIRALAPLARALAALRPDLPRFVTATTSSGRQRADQEIGAPAGLAPLDARGPVSRFLAAVDPCLHVMVETEIWPTRLLLLARRGTPAALVSARISPERAPRYRRLSGLYGPCLRSLALIAPASLEDQERLLGLGADPARFGPVGNLKWDAAPAPPLASTDVSGALGLDAAVDWIVLGSIHPEEALPLVTATERELGADQRVGWLIAPRHPERFNHALSLLDSRLGGVWKASRGPAPAGARLIVLDQIGLLPKVYPLARAAALGGSFAPAGGHTPLEAAAAGCPLVVGPHFGHQRDLVEPLAAARGLAVCRGFEDAGRTLAGWIANHGAARGVGAAARAEVDRRRGVAVQLAAALVELAP